MKDHTESATLLTGSREGNRTAAEAMMELIYSDVRAAAGRMMSKERASHTLQPTALANEAFARILGGQQVEARSRTHFFRLAAHKMRQVLVDHARRRKAAKRGDGIEPLPLLEVEGLASLGEGVDLLDFEDALQKLEQLDPREAQIVTMRFWAGMSEAAIAQELGISERTVRSDWAHARAFLHRELFPDR